MKDFVVGNTAKGKGVFVSRRFGKGEFIVKFNGKVYHRNDNPAGLDEDDNHYLQIGKDTFIGPSDTIDDMINHSCSPNSGLKVGKDVLLFAIKNIQKGEEITYDYSTVQDDGWKMKCLCKKRNCRKVVRDFQHLPARIQKKYIKLGIVPDYIVKSREKGKVL